MKYKEITKKDTYGDFNRKELSYINWAFKMNNIILKRLAYVGEIFKDGGIGLRLKNEFYQFRDSTVIFNNASDIINGKLKHDLESYKEYIELKETTKKILKETTTYELPKEVE